MKIFSREQIREADRLTIERQDISSTELMERAGRRIFEWLKIHTDLGERPVHIITGTGNNGGDGLVVGRYMLEMGLEPHVWIVAYSDKRSEDFKINLERFKSSGGGVTELTPDKAIPDWPSGSLFIDAVFGTGLNRPPADWIAKLFKRINDTQGVKVAIDIPSGLYMDRVPESGEFIFHADHTLSFQVAKLVFLLPQTGDFAGKWTVLDIGLDRDFIENQPVVYRLTGHNEVSGMIKERDHFSHKGDYGHVLLVGGSLGKMGAVVMSGKAALRAGSGLVSLFVPSAGNSIVQTALPEAMAIFDDHAEKITNIDFNMHPTIIGMGPGMGTDKATLGAFRNFLENHSKPMVLDADALNLLAENNSMINLLPKGSVLTPHPGELKRLIGEWKDDFDKLAKVKTYCLTHSLILVVKGAYTLITDGQRSRFNIIGNAGMATGGSGDVLTGVICALISQGLPAFDAATAGVYLHGLAGDLAKEKHGEQAMIATDIIACLGAAYKKLKSPL
ncbi:NAD(P)H-hydrate dehydratase [Robertkochia aurantiaca]|uniref:NAD(P)H-hydrate dehydratase n=1 Tax=Robertkochia aurantiaca TaxID=2873700 RepID=UPI001CCA9A6E|nr:NAD(P)H-hydrate dehydratase [Robertkochia sp. 3YJGBD-33]